MATWIWATDANAGSAGWEKRVKAAYLSFVFNTAANALPVYKMASVVVSSIPDMVTKVISAAGNDKISRMVLMGHGTSGVQGVGCGENVNLSGTTRNFLAVDPATGMLCNGAEADLNPLASYFSPGARLSLAGCWVASQPVGAALLQRISIALGNVTVEGGLWIQDAALPGYFGPVLRCSGSNCATIYGPYKEFR
jgi:hypothetical protein